MLFEATECVETAELRFKISRPIHSLRGHRWVQLERPPRHVRLNAIELSHCPLQPPLPDVTPWTDDVRIDLDLDSLIAHDKWPFFQATECVETAELRFKISRPIHSLRGHRWVQLERPPRHVRLNAIELSHCPLQPPLPDVTPWTDDVRIDLDLDSLIAHDKWPIFPA